MEHNQNVKAFSEKVAKIKSELRRDVVGQTEIIDNVIIAIIAGVKAATVLRWLLEIPEEERRGVLDVSMDFSDSMKLIAQTAFPNARISLDRFHVFQDLNRYRSSRPSREAFLHSWQDLHSR